MTLAILSAKTGGTVEYYTISPANITMPITSDVTGLVLNHYYNLKMSPVAGTLVSFPNSDLTIYNDLTKSDAGAGYYEHRNNTYNPG